MLWLDQNQKWISFVSHPDRNLWISYFMICGAVLCDYIFYSSFELCVVCFSFMLSCLWRSRWWFILFGITVWYLMRICGWLRLPNYLDENLFKFHLFYLFIFSVATFFTFLAVHKYLRWRAKYIIWLLLFVNWCLKCLCLPIIVPPCMQTNELAM